MATNNGPPLSRERRYANLFADRKRLGTPIDIETLVSTYATIEYVDFPTDCDALVVRKANTKPNVIVARRLRAAQSYTRLRFTLAHELAHIVLPWQSGTYFCHPTEQYAVSDYLIREIEAEANRFAAELLAPAEWVRSQLEALQGPLASRVSSMAETAQISWPAAVIAAGSRFFSGILIALVDPNMVVKVVSSSPDVFSVRVGDALDIDRLRQTGATISKERSATQMLVCAEFARNDAVAKPAASSRDIQAWILREICASEEAAGKVGMQLSGIAGALNSGSQGLTSPADFMNGLRLRMANRTGLVGLFTEHPLFNQWLAARGYELSEKRTAGRVTDG